ncbi:FadR/GntR family transcriptional regulator [Arsenicitalea aurantiaca]|nr:FadR/GntR family transcriptional regulator [Arsenicitalea aurantiaca]
MIEFAPPNPPLKGSGGGRTLSDTVYQQIYERISANEWPRGTRLPTEIEMADQFGVSRTVIREALLRLRIDGLIASRQGSGTHVIGAPSQRVVDFAEPGSVADLQRCYEFRVGVEGEAAYLAASRHTRPRIGEIEQTLVAMRACIDENRLGADEDISFHLAVARATENDYYQRTIESVTRAIRVGMSIAATLSHRPTPQRLGIAISEHEGILEAIRNSDPEAARARMRAHIEGARKRVFVGQ